MIYVEKNNYRIVPIISLIDGEVAIKDGLAIEKKRDSSDAWYVLCFIKFNNNENDYYIDCVGHRITNVDDFQTFVDLAKIAGATVCVMNKE